MSNEPGASVAPEESLKSDRGVAIASIVLPQQWLVGSVLERQVGLIEIALWVIAVGGVVTVIRRLRAAGRFLQSQSGVAPISSEDA